MANTFATTSVNTNEIVVTANVAAETLNWQVITPDTHVEYPSVIQACFKNPRALYVAGNLDLLNQRMVSILTSTYSSEKVRRNMALIIRVICKAYREGGHGIPTFLFSNEDKMDTGSFKVNTETGEQTVLWKGLATVALEEGANLVFFKAGKVSPRLAQIAYDNPENVLIVDVVNPETRVGFDGNVEADAGNRNAAHIRNAYVAALTDTLFGGEVAENGGTRHTFSQAHGLQKPRYIFNIKTGQVPLKNGGFRTITLANTEMFELEQCELIENQQQVYDMFK